MTAMRDGLGAISGFVAVAKDITDRKRVEEARRESEEWFAILSDASPIGIFRSDEQGHCQYTNARYQEITGLTLEQSLGLGWLEAVHPDDRELVLATRERSIPRGEDYEMELRFQRPDGDFTLVRSRIRPIVNARDQINGFVGIVEDITLARQAEETVRASESGCGPFWRTCSADSSPSIRTASSPASTRPRRGCSGTRPRSSSAEPGHPGSRFRRRQEGLSPRRPSEVAGPRHGVGGTAKERRDLPLRAVDVRLSHAAGRGTGRQRPRHFRTRAAEQAKKEFIATVSHELRTPLTSIRGSLRLLSSGVLGPLDPEVGRMIDIAERNSSRLLALINDLLDLERLENGRMTIQIGDASLDSIFRRSAESVAAFAEQENVPIRIASTTEHVRADEYRLTQVLVNLLSNAVKFSPPGAAVDVEARPKGGLVEVRVTDRGRGIPPPRETPSSSVFCRSTLPIRKRKAAQDSAWPFPKRSSNSTAVVSAWTARKGAEAASGSWFPA